MFTSEGYCKDLAQCLTQISSGYLLFTVSLTHGIFVSLLGAFLLALPLYACLPTSHTSCSFLQHAGPCPGMKMGLGPRLPGSEKELIPGKEPQ